MTGIRKSYAGVQAVRGATLRIGRPGTVHTLIGQNGCGKSSMLGMLSGQLHPEAGEIRLDGRPVRFGSAADAVRAGIGTVSQETALAEGITVAENVLMGRMVRTARGIDWKASRARAAEILGRLGLDYDPRWIVSRLRPDQKQMVEIARAISLETRILILDEPTSSLTEDEVRELFGTVRELAGQGVATLFVSHRLAEVFEISDELTVMRDGRTVQTGPAHQFTPQSLVDAMVGGVDLRGGPVTARGAAAERSDRPLLEVRGLRGEAVAEPVDLRVHPGRILGIAGLVGSGRSEVLETIFGVRPLAAGSVVVDGAVLHRPSPRACIRAGIGYIPPDRKLQGLVLPMSVADNVAMVAAHRRNRLGRPGRKGERAFVRTAAASVRMRAASLAMPVRALSGGNQQKVVFCKWMAARPRILLLDDPTRGVDVSAKADIHTQLRQAAADGLALVVTSSEIPELIELCDEVIVMQRGAVTHRFGADRLDEAAIATAAAGGNP